jgi:hypothetical protein
MGLHTFYKRIVPIILDITRDSHHITVHELQPLRSPFLSSLTASPGNEKITCMALASYKCYTP